MRLALCVLAPDEHPELNAEQQVRREGIVDDEDEMTRSGWASRMRSAEADVSVRLRGHGRVFVEPLQSR